MLFDFGDFCTMQAQAYRQCIPEKLPIVCRLELLPNCPFVSKAVMCSVGYIPQTVPQMAVADGNIVG